MSGVTSARIIGGNGKRHASDFYSTPVECTEALMNVAGHLLPGMVWEPACGTGAISNVLKQYGRDVLSTDLEDYGYGFGGNDFLKAERPHGHCIITNPPFTLAADFIAKAASFRMPFAMLLKSSFWHAERRRGLFYNTGPSHILAMTWRPAFVPEKGTASTMDFIWTIWGAEPSLTCTYLPVERGVRGVRV
jgi:hypothetical protein